MCVLMVNCIPNHTKCVDISPDFVIASINKIKMATTENSKLILLLFACEYLHEIVCIDGQLCKKSYKMSGHITWLL